MSSLARKFQQRLLNSNKYEDYIFAFLIPIIPVILSIMLGIWKHTNIKEYRFTGYEDAINHYTLIVSLPLSLFFLRKVSDYLFGLNINNDKINEVPILEFFKDEELIQSQIHNELKTRALNPNITYVALFYDLVLHIFDIGEILKQYLFTFLGYKVQYIEIYWANLYLERKDVDIYANLFFTIIAYLGQFWISIIAVTAISLFLTYNIFYLKIIYQRRRDKENTLGKVVLNFDDINNCFGLNNINSSFNIQLFMLFFAGVVALFSRITLTNYKFQFSNLNDVNLDNINNLVATLVKYLYPQFGQYVIVVLWLLTFLIVLMPSFVKFLPLFSCEKLLSFKTWTLLPYLKEFIPISHDIKYNKYSKEVVDDLASKFAGNSFWPSGDDTARWMFYFVFFICLVVLFPLNYISTFIFLIIAVLLGNIFLNIFRWFLGHVDVRLVNRNNNIKLGDIIMAFFDQRNQTVTYQYNAAGNISFGSVKNRVDLIGELEKLKNEVSRAGEAKVIDPDKVTDVQYQIQKAVDQAKKPQPSKNPILEHLGKAKDLISTVGAANGIVNGIKEAIELVNQFF